MIKNHLKIAWRSLRKNKGLHFLNIIGLTIGMTAAVLIFLWVQNELSFDNDQKDAGRIYRTTTRLPNGWVWEGSPLLEAAAFKKEVPGIEKITRLYVDHWPVFQIHDKLHYEKHCAYVDNNWFSLFKYQFIEGGAASFAQNPYSIILTESAAKKWFGNKEAVGEVIQVDSSNYEVTGVVADPPANSSFQYRSFIPLPALLNNKQILENGEDWGNTDYLTFIKLLPGIQPGVTAKRLTEVFQKYSQDNTHSFSISLIPIREMHFETDLLESVFEHGSMNSVYIFSILGFLLLTIACINYVNLTTAKASLRSKEISIRKIVGADRSHLFSQFLVESLLISLISLAITFILIHWCLPAFNTLTGKNFTLSLTSPDFWRVIGGTLLVSFLLNGIYPALLLSSFNPINLFKGISLLNVRGTSFRKKLVVLQFSISAILITSTIVIYKQMHFIQKRNPGYDRSQVLSFTLPQAINSSSKELLMNTVKQELLGHSSIESVAIVSQPIIQIGSITSGADWEGRNSHFNPKVAQLSADAGLQKTMHLQMQEGRWFQQGNETDKHNFILNESAVRKLHLSTPVIGQRFSLHGDKGRIIGVVRDFNYKSMHEKIGPLVIFNNPDWWNFFLVRTAPQRTSLALKAITQTWKKTFPGIPLAYSFLDDQFEYLYKQDQLDSLLIWAFAVIAVIISGLGLFGLVAFAAEQRNKEMSIRKILGATLADISSLLSTDFLKLIGIPFIISFPLTWWAMSKWLQNFAYSGCS